MNILCIGDIVGSVGLNVLVSTLPKLINELKIDFVIANAENLAGGLGATVAQVEELLSFGVNVLTSGNHIWKKKEILPYLANKTRLIRPANYPEGVPGRGSCVVQLYNGPAVGVINVMGRVFMEPLDCPFRSVDREVAKISSLTKIIVVDFHAEATSEKVALGRYLDGRVTAVVGTHTHIQTSDEKILPQGTAYITDLGMTGPHDSIIGMKKEIALEKFLTQLPKRLEVAKDDPQVNGVLIKVDTDTGKAQKIQRLNIPQNPPKKFF